MNYNSLLPTPPSDITNKTIGKQFSELYNNYYNRYDYYKDSYSTRSEFLIPLNIHVWLDDDGTNNYEDTHTNRAVFEKAIEYVNEIYGNNQNSYPKLDWVVDYPSTKIQFRLDNIYFHNSTEHWKMGASLSSREGIILNRAADALAPESIGNYNIHFTGVKARASGYSIFPNYSMNTEHFIVSFNGNNKTHMGNNNSWPMGIHLAHELGHSLDLYHTYSRGNKACEIDDPDYLDDIFGKPDESNCPHSGGWDCAYDKKDSPCTENIMGGTKGGRYFSPKQIQRMHRALSLKSIRKYAIAKQFNKNNILEIKEDQTWDFSIKLYNNLHIRTGATLIVQDAVHFVPEAGIFIEEGGKLIIDGGVIRNEEYHESTWQGIRIQQKKKSTRKQNKFIELINGGTIKDFK